MPLQPINLGVRSNTGRLDYAARLINCYAEDAGEEAKSRWPVYACDGFSSFATLSGAGAGAVRGMLNVDDTTLYVVTGSHLNRSTTGGTVTDMGDISASGIAYMARNRRDAAPDVGIVTSAATFKVYRSNSDVTPDLTSTHPTTLFNSLCTLDGYGIITSANGEFHISAIDDWTSWDELAYAQTYLDLKRGIVRGRDLIVFGAKQGQAWQNTGATDFAFERVTSFENGIYMPGSAVTIGDSVLFVGTNADGALVGVMALDGYQARKISVPALDKVLRDEASPDAVTATSYSSSGHVFYSLSGTDWTWEFDVTTGFWHERTSSGLDRWQISFAETFNNTQVVGNYNSAALYTLSDSITPGSASTCSLRHSNDGGTNWIGPRAKAIGGSGETTTRVKYNRLGQSKEDGKVFEITISNAVIENGTANSMIINTPQVHSYPYPMRFHTLYVDTTPGVSLTSSAKGAVSLAVDAEAVRG